MRLLDAARCPYCARVRMALDEKSLAYETVEIDLDNRPSHLYDVNPAGRVPVLDDGFALPESAVIMAYLEERYPERPLLPRDPAGRALAQLAVHRFDDALGREYYRFRRGEQNALDEQLAQLELGESLYADIAYAPWVMRARDVLGLRLPVPLDAWLASRAERPSFARELAIVAAM